MIAIFPFFLFAIPTGSAASPSSFYPLFIIKAKQPIERTAMSYNSRKKVPEQGRKDYLVTLALEQNAQVGKEFVHDEIPGACKECPLYQICMKNLEKGRVYLIKEVNDNTRHECPKKLFPGEMVVVKVKEKPLLVTFPSSKTFEGMRLTYQVKAAPRSCAGTTRAATRRRKPSPRGLQSSA
jgi:uncharacterized protein (UPF0179 family)